MSSISRFFTVAALVVIPGVLAWTPPAQSQAIKPTPRTADGKPDLTGVYQTSNRRGAWDAEIPGNTPGAPLPRTPGTPQVRDEPVPFQPWARAKAQELLNRRSVDDPTAYCIPPPWPRVPGLFPIQFVQTPSQVIILHEYMRVFRIIPTDDRGHPDDEEPAFLGNSVGRWEGDTLVVDVDKFKDGAYLTSGIALSDAAHMTERFTRVDYDQLNYVVVIDDSKVFTKPWTVHRTFMLREGIRLREDICPENNLDPARFQEYLKKPELLLRSPRDGAPR
jgi:hypothetical protein